MAEAGAPICGVVMEERGKIATVAIAGAGIGGSVFNAAMVGGVAATGASAAGSLLTRGLASAGSRFLMTETGAATTAATTRLAPAVSSIAATAPNPANLLLPAMGTAAYYATKTTIEHLPGILSNDCSQQPTTSRQTAVLNLDNSSVYNSKPDAIHRDVAKESEYHRANESKPSTSKMAKVLVGKRHKDSDLKPSTSKADPALRYADTQSAKYHEASQLKPTSKIDAILRYVAKKSKFHKASQQPSTSKADTALRYMDVTESKPTSFTTPIHQQSIKETITSTPVVDSNKFSKLPGFTLPDIPSTSKIFTPDHSDIASEMNILYQKQYLETVEKINNRYPINADWAGKKFPLSPELEELYPEGVWFKENGHPDFTPYAIKGVVLENLTGKREKDAGRANKAAGLASKVKGYIWHHVEDGRTMQLVPKALHDYVKHTGGAAKQIAEKKGK